MNSLDARRQAAIEALSEYFANDAITVEELERRVDRAHRAASLDELRDVLSDLPGANVPMSRSDSPATARSGSSAPPQNVPDRGFAIAVLGGTRRTGRWTPSRANIAIAVMGGAEIDFREAVMGPGVTELRVFAVMGGVEIIVPPDMNVASHGIGLLGGFGHSEQGVDDPTAPTLNVTGIAVMGGVDITVRYPGETARDARRRRRQERRDQARAIREGRGENRGRLTP